MTEVTIKAQQNFGDTRVGDVVTVERTPYVDRLITNGRVVVVDDEPTTTVSVTDPTLAPQPPARNSSRDDWAEFLAEHSPIVTAGKSRDELIAEYDTLTAPVIGDDDVIDGTD